VGTAVFFKMIIGLAGALLLSMSFRGRNLIRSLLFIPWTLPVFVVALLWLWQLDTKGAINVVLRKIGLQPVTWLGIQYAMPSIILVNVWKGFPFYMISLLAGLQAIPTEIYEAASIDGATNLQKFIYVSLPGIKPVFLTVIMLSTIWTFSEFITIYLITGGGPARTTTTLPLFIYEQAFASFDFTGACAASVLILPLFIALIYGIMKIIGR